MFLFFLLLIRVGAIVLPKTDDEQNFREIFGTDLSILDRRIYIINILMMVLQVRLDYMMIEIAQMFALMAGCSLRGLWKKDLLKCTIAFQLRVSSLIDCVDRGFA